MKVVISGGGTGGHLFPAIAVAEAWSGAHPSDEIIFVGTSYGLEVSVLPKLGMRLELISVPQFKGMSAIRKLFSVFVAATATVRAAKLIKKLAPGIVIGVGGYASGPVTLAAALLGIPTAIMEQNSIPGMTNKILGHFVKKVFITYPDSARYFTASKVVKSGNPVRRAIINDADKEISLGFGKKVVLCFGGSQGARAINSAMVAGAKKFSKIKDKLHIVHQVGAKADVKGIYEEYKKEGVSAEVHAFINDMWKYYAMADLVVCRAGATSLAELSVEGLPAILAPYPYAADDHQEFNARYFSKHGAAIIMHDDELDNGALADEVIRLVDDDETLDNMANAMKRLACPGAAATIVSECVRMLKNV